MARRVVIIGGGFGGLAAARRLRNVEGLEIVLIDQRNHHTFQPLLYQVATAALATQDVGQNLRGIARQHRHARVRLGTACGADWKSSAVLLDDGGSEPFDDLVIAAGAVTDDFGVPGVAEHAFPLKSLGDAVVLRNHVLALFEQVSATAPEEGRKREDAGMKTFVVAGGGPTGVEVAGALQELFANVVRRDYPEVDVAETRVVLAEMADSLLPGFSPRSQRYALHKLRARGVEVLLGTGIAEVEPRQVRLGDGRRLETRTVVWATGVRASPLTERLGLERDRTGRLTVDEGLRVPGHGNVYAVGDIAAIPDRRTGVTPQLAPVALQSGRHAAEQILRSMAGHRPTSFRYIDKGVMATVGRNAAVAELPFRLSFRGFPAWLAWLGLHLVFLIGFRNRVSVLLQWAWSYVTYDRSARVVFEEDIQPFHDQEQRAPKP